MKRAKPNLTMVATIVAIGLSVSDTKASTTKSSFVDVWYEFTGPQTEAGYRTESNYVKYVPQPSNIKIVCPSADILCAIKAPDNGTTPAPFGSVFESQIINAVQTNTETAQIELEQ